MSETRMGLRKVTPRALKVYQKQGLMNVSSDIEAAQATLSALMDTKALKAIWDVTFTDPIRVEELEDVDLAEVTGGIQDFLGQLSGPAKR